MEISLSSLAIFLCSFPTQTKDQMCNLGLRYHCKPLHFLLRKNKENQMEQSSTAANRDFIIVASFLLIKIQELAIAFSQFILF